MDELNTVEAKARDLGRRNSTLVQTVDPKIGSTDRDRLQDNFGLVRPAPATTGRGCFGQAGQHAPATAATPHLARLGVDGDGGRAGDDGNLDRPFRIGQQPYAGSRRADTDAAGTATPPSRIRIGAPASDLTSMTVE